MQSVKNQYAKELCSYLENVKKNLKSLQILEYKGKKLSNALSLNVTLETLDLKTHKYYDLTLKDNDVSDIDLFVEFLERCCEIA